MQAVYCIENTINCKLYIGSAVNIKERWKIHKVRLNNNKHHSPHLQAAWNKYGSGCFVFKVLEVVPDKHDLIKREQWWMDIFETYKPEYGYNVCHTAGSTLGKKLSEEHKQKLIEANKSRKWSEETRRKMSEAHKGKKLSEETLQKLRNKKLSEEHKQRLIEAHKGKKCSEETRRKISESNKLVWQNEEYRKKMREIMTPIWQSKERSQNISRALTLRNQTNYDGFINPEGQAVTIRNMAQFCKDNKLSHSGIWRLMKGKWKQYKGWTYRKEAV